MSEKDPRLSHQTLRVLRVFLDKPREGLAGSDIWRETKIFSGTLYPILMRLEKAGWLESWWEELDPSEAGRPRKRLYRTHGHRVQWRAGGFARSRCACREARMELIITIVLGVAISVVASVITNEAYAWMPKICEWLLDRAVRRLPGDLQARYREEWQAHLHDLPNSVTKLTHALGCLSCARARDELSLSNVRYIVRFDAIFSHMYNISFDALNRAYSITLTTNHGVLSEYQWTVAKPIYWLLFYCFVIVFRSRLFRRYVTRKRRSYRKKNRRNQ